ncbi:hypothetical protein BDN72DRAFT_830161 [Pluteus cervinus]|uniref:Uncharacterized protein n=1 Tax=Pluteus cervinus TaxID=181527 RepID=A0ACD3BIR1_9AGAR|nr:hypothetical protein BDN72DRAFT_830161 [Pluteus cervinus]
MTAVLSPMDPLRSDRHLSLDDNVVNYSSSTDWRAKYEEVVEMLDGTRSELDEFYQASKEVEAELESEIQRNEKIQQELRVKVERTESERDNWKAKFMSLQTTHNTTTTSLQRELDRLRQDYQQAKVQLRELEMGNDDLERSERAVSSSLVDMEAKYSRALEEKILLEHELLEKAGYEEETQRLKDELRDANVEILVLKDQIVAFSSSSNTRIGASSSKSSLTSNVDSTDNLLDTTPPPDFQLTELSPEIDALASSTSTQATPKASRIQAQPSTPTRSGLPKAIMTPTGIARSTTLPSLRSPPVPPRMAARTTSTASTASNASTSRNKGVQMVSEMRARVKTLEQKIHTRVPRLRMTSVTRPSNNPALTTSSIPPSSLSSINASRPLAKSTWDGFGVNQRRSAEARRSTESEKEKAKQAAGESSGWVLIMEDSPSPPKPREVHGRRTSSPSAPTAFRAVPLTAALNASIAASKTNSLAQSTLPGLRRPSSRLSGGSLSTTTTSSIPTPSSRPATPTFLPIPTSSAQATTSSAPGLKRSATNGAGQPKRASLGGSSSATMLPPDRPPIRPATGTPLSSSTRYGFEGGKLPQLPSLANVTMRAVSKPNMTTTTSSLAKSRIGRPSSTGVAGRKSVGEADKDPMRHRAGSSIGVYGKDFF